MTGDLLLRNICLPDGGLADMLLQGGKIAAIGRDLSADAPVYDGQGAQVQPSLYDHHIHLFATAAKMQSLDLSGLVDGAQITAAIREYAAAQSGEAWLRIIGLDETIMGLPDAQMLDEICGDLPMRVQDRTGALWILNSKAITFLGAGPWPDFVECNGKGRPNGRIWRGDKWLRNYLPSQLPDLSPLSQFLLSKGVTGVSDAGAHNDAEAAALLAAARADGRLAQKLMLMGMEDLPASPHYSIGPLKLHFDESNLPDVSVVAARIKTARGEGRNVAAHCTALAELLFYLAALDRAGGAIKGDRIEHGSIIPKSMLAEIAEKQLMIVTQPAFVAARGDRYLRMISADERGDLYRLKSILDARLSLAAGSDAPYGPLDPWAAIQAAQDRRTLSGALLSLDEGISYQQALQLYQGALENPAQRRQIAAGEVADLMLLNGPSKVQATIVDGAIAYKA